MCTYHCFIRGKQRFDFSLDDTINITERAYYKGRPSEDFTGREQRYLQNKESDNTCVKVLGNMIFVFDELEVCITVYPVPSWFGKEKKHSKTLSEKFEDVFLGCSFADIIYNNQFKAIMAS